MYFILIYFLFMFPVIVLKYHGSYMQDNRDNRKKGIHLSHAYIDEFHDLTAFPLLFVQARKITVLCFV